MSGTATHDLVADIRKALTTGYAVSISDPRPSRSEAIESLDTLAARLERVEAAAREAHHIAMTRRIGGPHMDGSEQFASPAFKQIRDVLAAALSDVTPLNADDS
jgi:hypothetical protein